MIQPVCFPTGKNNAPCGVKMGAFFISAPACRKQIPAFIAFPSLIFAPNQSGRDSPKIWKCTGRKFYLSFTKPSQKEYLPGVK